MYMCVPSQSMSICYANISIMNFLVMQLYSPMLSYLTLAGLFWFCGIMAAIALVYLSLFIRETNQKSVG